MNADLDVIRPECMPWIKSRSRMVELNVTRTNSIRAGSLAKKIHTHRKRRLSNAIDMLVPESSASKLGVKDVATTFLAKPKYMAYMKKASKHYRKTL